MNLLSSHKFLVWGFLGVFGITATIGHTSGEASDLEALSGAVTRPNRVGTGRRAWEWQHPGLATRLRCAAYLAHPRSRVYELGRVLSDTMPQNPFGDAPVDLDYLPTRGIPSRGTPATVSVLGRHRFAGDAIRRPGSLRCPRHALARHRSVPGGAGHVLQRIYPEPGEAVRRWSAAQAGSRQDRSGGHERGDARRRRVSGPEARRR